MEIQASLALLWNQYRGLPRRLQWLVVGHIILATLPALAFLFSGFMGTILVFGVTAEITLVLAFWAGMIADWPDQAVVGVALAQVYAAIFTTIGFTGYSPVQNSPPAEQLISWVGYTASHIVSTLALALVFQYIRRHVARLELLGPQPPGAPFRLPRKALVGLIGLVVLVALLGLGVALTSGDNHWLLSVFFQMLLLYLGAPLVVLGAIAAVLAPGRSEWRLSAVFAVATLLAAAFVLTDYSVTQAFDPADWAPLALICLPIGMLLATLEAVRRSGFRLMRVSGRGMTLSLETKHPRRGGQSGRATSSSRPPACHPQRGVCVKITDENTRLSRFSFQRAILIALWLARRRRGRYDERKCGHRDPRPLARARRVEIVGARLAATASTGLRPRCAGGVAIVGRRGRTDVG